MSAGTHTDITRSKRVQPDANLVVRMELIDASHSTDAISVSAYMAGMAYLMNYSSEVHGHKEGLPVHVSAFTAGSFEFVLDIIQQTGRSLAPLWGGAVNVAGVIETVFTYLELKKFLGGKKPRSRESQAGGVTFVNEAGASMTVNVHVAQLNDHPKADKTLVRMYDAAEKDENIQAISHRSDLISTSTVVERDQFDDLRVFSKDSLEVSEVEIPSILFKVVSAKFDEEFKVITVSHRGERSKKAVIEDESYRAAYFREEHLFGPKTYIRCRAVIQREWNDLIQAEVEKGYVIKQVLEHISKGSDQLSLF